MARFLGKRLMSSIVALIGVLLMTFVIAHISPTDPARQYAGKRATPEQYEAAVKHLGLDRNIFVQLGVYGKNFVTGNWGESLISKRSVLNEVGRSLPLHS